MTASINTADCFTFATVKTDTVRYVVVLLYETADEHAR